LVQQIEVVEPAAAELPELSVERMEELALAQNADIREQHYASRIAVKETRAALLRLFPNLSFNYGYNHDDDSYLINNEWTSTGLQLSFNLFNLLAAPSQLRLAEAGIAVADQRRVATQMAVLAQVHL